MIVYNNLVSEHHSQVGTTESPDREFVSSNPSTSFSLAELVGWGTGAFLLGVLVTTMATMWILNLRRDYLGDFQTINCKNGLEKLFD